MLVSIIILNWNGGADDCLAAVSSAISQDYQNKEVIFVDNFSTDGSLEAVKSEFPEIKYIQTGKNLGCPGGRNYGAKFAGGDIICFLENDGLWESSDVVSTVCSVFDKHPDIGAAYIKVKGFKSNLTDRALDGHPSDNCSNGIYLSSSFRGGASFIRADLFAKFYGFPSDFFRQGEERFLSILLYEGGFKVVYIPQVTMLHKGSDYTGKSNAVFKLNFENELKTILRLYPYGQHLRTALLKWIYYIFIFSLKGNLNDFLNATTSAFKSSKLDIKHKRASHNTIKLIDELRYGDIQINIEKNDISLDKLINRKRHTILSPYMNKLFSKLVKTHS